MIGLECAGVALGLLLVVMAIVYWICGGIADDPE